MLKISAAAFRRALAAFAVIVTALWQCGAFSAFSNGDAYSGGHSVATSRSERLVDDAIKYLEELPSFSADVDFETWLFDNRYFGHGRYEELTFSPNDPATKNLPPLERTCFLLRVATTAEENSSEEAAVDTFEIVCDCKKRAWWRYNSTSETAPLSQIGTEELKNALRRLGDEEERCLKESGVKAPCGMNGMPGLGGLAGTLKRVASFYQFQPEYQEVVSTGRNESATLPTDSFLKVSGRSNTRFRFLTSANLDGFSDTVPDFIAENLPAYVEIYFRMVDDGSGRRRPFPCKIVYFADDKSQEKDSIRPLFSVEYSSVVRNDPTIDLNDFDFVQPQITFDRLNNEYVRELTEPILADH